MGMNRKQRLLLVVAAGLVVVALAAVYLNLRFGRSVGSGPAGPSVPREKFSTIWSTNRVLLIGLGDSVTAGFGARKGYSYFDRLAKNPGDEFSDLKGICLSAVFPNLATTNLAVSGSTSFELLDLELPHLQQVYPQVKGLIVITAGGNDLIHNYGRTPPRPQAMYGGSWTEAQPWIASFEDRLERAVTNLPAHFPAGVQVFIANIYDPTDGVGDIEDAGLPAWPDGQRILAAYNEVIDRICKKHSFAHLVDMHELFLGHGLRCRKFWRKHYDGRDPHYWYFTNLEDPNERGYDALRRLFLIEVAKNSSAF